MASDTERDTETDNGSDTEDEDVPIDLTTVRGMIDDAAFNEVETVTSDDDVFQINCWLQNTAVSVTGIPEEERIVVSGRVEIEDWRGFDSLSTPDREALYERISEVVCGQPVTRHFVDELGQPVTFDEAREIRVARRLYEDSGQQEIMDAVFLVRRYVDLLNVSVDRFLAQ
ncbi:MAG: hypothetical protein SV253_08980 [Halobacteria archaeon]|nr:hypothetical protein [Halobacteria archaeon]